MGGFIFPQVQQMLDQLNDEWVSFQQCLIDSDVMLKKSKEKFKTGLIHSSEDFKKTVTTLFDDFQNKGPFSSSINVKEVCKLVGGGGGFQWFELYLTLKTYHLKRNWRDRQESSLKTKRTALVIVANISSNAPLKIL